MVQHQTHLVQGRIDTVRKKEEEEEARQPFCTACNKRHVVGLIMGVCVVMVPDSGFHQSGRPAHY
jgi:hypothetical protein